MQVQVYRAVMQTFKLTMAFRPEWLASVPGMPQLMASRYFYRIPKDEALLKRGLLDYLQLDAGTAVACADDAASTAIPEAGARIAVPTLLIACRQDHVMPPENVDYTVSTIPNCRAIWIEECGHLPMVEKPEEFMQIMEDFLLL
jgi:pimeloyl-ACP methyl ester carboxylesterase